MQRLLTRPSDAHSGQSCACAQATPTPTLAMQAVTRKTRILDVCYNASNNELVRHSAKQCSG